MQLLLKRGVLTQKGLDPCMNAIVLDNLELVQYLHKNGHVFYAYHMDRACKSSLDIVQFLHNIKTRCTVKAMDLAAIAGKLDIAEFLHYNRSEGCTTDAMDGAAEQGHLRIVEFLHDNR